MPSMPCATDIAARAVAELQAGRAAKSMVTAALLAVNRSTELVSDHHGGAVHPTSGGWAVLLAIDRLP